MYYACDVLQDAIRCSGGSSRATAAATSAGAHSHVGGMSGISPTRPLPRNFRTFCPCNREWREEFRPWRSTVGGRTPSLRMILVRSARAAGPPPERPIALRYRGTRRPKWWPIVKSRRCSCRRSSPPASMRARSFARAMRSKSAKVRRGRSDDYPAQGCRIRPETPVQARDGGNTAGIRLRGGCVAS